MIVSHNRVAIPISLQPHGHGTGSPTPFWELEELIALGFGRDVALKVMAVRRQEHPVLAMPEVSAEPARPDHQRVLLSHR